MEIEMATMIKWMFSGIFKMLLDFGYIQIPFGLANFEILIKD